MQLKILTYNIHKGRRAYSSSFMLEELKAAIERTGADIVCLQEVQGAHKRISAPQFERLADRLWSHYAYARNALTQQGHHGNAILSRFPIRNQSNTNVSLLRGASRSILQAEIEMPDAGGRSVQIMCVHMGLFGFERRMQIAALESRIDSLPADMPLLVAGDFNDWTGSGHQLLKRRGDLQELSEAMNGRLTRSFPATRPLLAVDRIYTRHLQPLSVETSPPAMWRNLSDHIPLIGTVALPHPVNPA